MAEGNPPMPAPPRWKAPPFSPRGLGTAPTPAPKPARPVAPRILRSPPPAEPPAALLPPEPNPPPPPLATIGADVPTPNTDWPPAPAAPPLLLLSEPPPPPPPPP